MLLLLRIILNDTVVNQDCNSFLRIHYTFFFCNAYSYLQYNSKFKDKKKIHALHLQVLNT